MALSYTLELCGSPTPTEVVYAIAPHPLFFAWLTQMGITPVLGTFTWSNDAPTSVVSEPDPSDPTNAGRRRFRGIATGTATVGYLGPYDLGSGVQTYAGTSFTVEVIDPSLPRDSLNEGLTSAAFGAATYQGFWGTINGAQPLSGTLYVGLYSGDPNDGGTELSGGAYARVSVLAADFTDDGNGTFLNDNLITFPNPTGDWVLATHCSFHDAASAGNLLASGPLTVPYMVLNSMTPRYFEPGALACPA